MPYQGKTPGRESRNKMRSLRFPSLGRSRGVPRTYFRLGLVTSSVISIRTYQAEAFTLLRMLDLQACGLRAGTASAKRAARQNVKHDRRRTARRTQAPAQKRTHDTTNIPAHSHTGGAAKTGQGGVLAEPGFWCTLEATTASDSLCVRVCCVLRGVSFC